MNLKLTALLSIFAVALSAAAPQTQAPASSAPASQAQPVENLSFEPIGPGDLLFLYVSNSVDSTRSVRVSADGTISVPSLKDPLPVAGLLSTEVEKVVAAAFTANKVLVEPVVFVSVVEYRSKPVNVSGAVHQPLSFQALGNVHLLDAISRAQGLAPEAGSEILVTRPGTNGSGATVEHISVEKLMKSDPASNLQLLGGEQVQVPPAGKFFVVGNVKNPGSYQISEGEGTTVLKALALCQGTMAFTREDAYLYRMNPNIPGRQEITVPIKKIMKRQATDMRLEPNDIFYIPDNGGKRLTASVIDRIAAVGGSTVSGILVFANR